MSRNRAESAPNAHAPGAAFLPLDALKPNPRNPRMHGDEIARLARTILRTAWGAPIVAQARSHRIIAGHGRIEAARMILAGMVVDGEPRGGSGHRFDPAAEPGEVPVRLVDVSDAEADAMTLADNAGALQGSDDAAAIVAMAAQFGRESAAMADIGMSAEALDALVKEAGDAVLRAGEGDMGNAFGALPDGDKAPFQQMTFTLHDSQRDVVAEALERAKAEGPFDGSPNENSNGNALARMAEAYLG